MSEKNMLLMTLGKKGLNKQNTRAQELVPRIKRWGDVKFKFLYNKRNY